MTDQILLVEDESGIADNVTYALKSEGFSCQWVCLGSEAIEIAKQANISLIILDIGLPDMSGLEVCKQIRAFSDAPIIFLTARSEEIDRVVGLEIGADDYVSKPFSPRELVARVKAVQRRCHATHRVEAVTKTIGAFQIDESATTISYYGVCLQITRSEYLILKSLLSEPGRVFSREQLLNSAWEQPVGSLERSVDTHIKSIRAKLRAIKDGEDPIKTQRGFGYSLATQ